MLFKEGAGMDPFEFMDVTEDEVAGVLDVIEEGKGVRNRQVCICGHPMVRHALDRDLGHYVCSPNAAGCMCTNPRGVLEVSDLRKFLRSTKGMGASHALTQGMLAAKRAEVEMEWVEGGAPGCDKCKTVGIKVIPAPVNARGEILDKSSSLNVFLCSDCLL